jgi:hypothetical protein
VMAYFSPDEVARWSDDNSRWQSRALTAERQLGAVADKIFAIANDMRSFARCHAEMLDDVVIAIREQKEGQ